MQVISLRSRLVYRCNDNALLKELYSFSLNYNEFLSNEIITLINFISSKETLPLNDAKEFYNHILNFTELMFERVQIQTYVYSCDKDTSEQAYEYNDKLFNMKVNYFRMKHDLYTIYKEFFRTDNVFINSFLKQVNKLQRKMNGEYDDAQLSVDGYRIFG
jgi:hypothetical protein